MEGTRSGRMEDAMTNEPVEPSEVYTREGDRVPAPRGAADLPAALRSLTPGQLGKAVVRAATAGPVLTASAFAAAALAAVKAAELAGRMAWPGAAQAWQQAPGSGSATLPGGVQISWTHVEIRWPTGQ